MSGFSKRSPWVFLFILGLSGCASITDSLLLPIPVDVHIVHSQRTPSGEKGPYPFATPVDEQNLPEIADLIKTEDLNVGLFFQSLKTVEWMAKDSAFRNEADIAVIRPRDTIKRIVWYLRVEIWRTKGYRQQIKDDIPPAGTTLLPPAGATYTTRVRNIEECASEAAALHTRPLMDDEASLIVGRDTTLFVDWAYQARRDVFWRPTQLGWEGDASTRIPDGASGQYVVCLMKRGYQWPQPLTTQN